MRSSSLHGGFASMSCASCLGVGTGVWRRAQKRARARALGHWKHDCSRAKGVKLEPMPVGLILAVVLDAGIDGMLIGLASSVAVSSGVFMSIATIFEMGFLGYSFACSVVPACRSKVTAVAVLATPPLVMLAASVTAAEFSANVDRAHPLRGPPTARALAALPKASSCTPAQPSFGASALRHSASCALHPRARCTGPRGENTGLFRPCRLRPRGCAVPRGAGDR